MAKKQPKSKASKIRESNESENETESEGDAKGAGANDDHADADQDTALIKKMVAEYVGDGSKSLTKQEHEALHNLGKEAYGAHKEMGKKEDEAFKHAGEAVKLAHHMASKQKAANPEESETESEEDGDTPPPPKKKKKPAPADDSSDGDGDDDDGDSSESETEESEGESEGENKKESNREKSLNKKLLEAEGRLAALEGVERKRQLDGYIDKKLKESGQPSAITKRFREAAGKIKNKTDFDSKWKLFSEAVKDQSSTADDDWGHMMERSTSNEDGERTSANADAVDFSDCAE